MFNRIVCATLFVLTYAQPCFADWQYTKWGMTPQQVEAASLGKALPLSVEEVRKEAVPAAPYETLVKGPYSSGRFEFTASFGFDKQGNGLTSVRIKLNDASRSNELLHTLRTLYGVAANETTSTLVHRVDWYTDIEQVTYRRIGERLTEIQYQPRKTKANQGL